MIGRWTQGMRRPTLLAYSTNTLWIAHRGDAFRYPENTTEAYAASVAAGLDVIEQDVQVLSDGALCVMHDATVDRTTTSTGNVSSVSTAGWLALNIDAATWFGGGFANGLVPPLMSGVLTLHRDDAIFAPEAKVSAAAAPLVSALISAGIRPEQATVQSATLAWIADAVTYGYPAMFVSSAGGEDKATVWAAGVRAVCLSDSVADAVFTAWLAYGFRVLGYTVDRHYQRTRLSALGVTGYFSDDIEYARATAALRTTDDFASQTWAPGMIGQFNGLSEFNRGRFASPNYWGWSNSSGNAFVLHGYLCPVASPSSFIFDLKVTFDSVNGGDQTRWANVFIGTSDHEFTDSNNGVSSGYTFLMRKSGRMQIYRYDAGVVTASLALTDTAAIADGTEVSYRITISPTAVSIARLTGTTGTASVSDATYRGGYIFLGRNGAAVRFRSLAVS